jgi:hypothetical protein
MTKTTSLGLPQPVRLFKKDAVRNGRRVCLNCVDVGRQSFCIKGKFVKVATLEQEWYEDVVDPHSIAATLTGFRRRPDILSFWQRVPDNQPRYEYYMEWESLAVLPVKSFDCWWTNQIKGTTRNMVRKSQKAGVVVREVVFDDDFVRGMVDIFNEAPVRQGFRFWHYGKDFETVKSQFSRFLFREDIIGAYYQGELIGFAMVANAGRYGIIGMFISKLKHRDKATNNALMAKAVEVCEKRQLPYLIYTTWRETSLVDFKRHSGFQQMRVPRYFIPLTQKGSLALKLGFHHDLRELLPNVIKKPLKRFRKRWYDLWNNAD